MQKTSKIHEKFLSEIWKKQNFSKSLFTQDGQKVEIIDSGMENNELGGPDFKNARIKIGNLTYFGDVEIDSFHSDWKAHGHSINKKYNKVVLHAVLDENTFQPFVFTQEGRKIQSICLNKCSLITLELPCTKLSYPKGRIELIRSAAMNSIS